MQTRMPLTSPTTTSDGTGRSPGRLKIAHLWSAIAITIGALVPLLAAQCVSGADVPPPATAPIVWPEEDLSGRLMDGAHKFVERKIADAPKTRAQQWKYDFSSPEAYAKSVETNRARLREIIGLVDARPAPSMERFGDDENPYLVAEAPGYFVEQVRWPVVAGVTVEGLLVTSSRALVGSVVLIPDADQSPEQLIGLAGKGPAESQIARRLVENGFTVLIPGTVSREKFKTDDPKLRQSDQTYREWIARQAYHMGRHVIGYEVQSVLAGVDWLAQRRLPGQKIGVVGYGEGGLVAFYAAAVDPRIDVALVSGYFGDRQAVWSEPIYRNVWSLVKSFGDAEIASLILPRQLVVEYSTAPAITGHKGDVTTPDFARAKAEIERIPTNPALPRPAFVHAMGQATGPWSPAALREFARGLGLDSDLPLRGQPPTDRRLKPDLVGRQLRLVDALEGHVQGLVRASEATREKFFFHKVLPELTGATWNTEKRRPVHDPQKFIDGAKPYRKQLREEIIGQFDERPVPANPRARKILETDKWVAWDVVLDVYPELIAWGALVVPKDLKPGERRPVVVCQHGRNGLPRDSIDRNTTTYNQFAARLAERGFITFCPHNLYRGEDRYRWLDRKAESIGCTLWSVIVAQHEQILNWLETLPYVDGKRIAFYGLSFGGETAVRVPTVLEKYCLSICSGDFNQWARKTAATDNTFTFMKSIEWEIPHWNLGNTFDYSEMASLMIPRPFMVERGHLDLVGQDQWVAYEYGRIAWLYAQLGLADRTEIEFFQGGHSINGEGTFKFLHRHLNWPEK